MCQEGLVKPCKETTVIERIKSVMEKAGVAPGVVDDLVQQVTEPPAGTIDAAVLQAVLANAPQPACETRIALLAAVVAAASPRNTPTSEVLQPLLDFVSTEQATLSAYDHGRFWHLRGVVAFREDIYTAARPLNRSIALIENEVTPQAQEYRARVLNTLWRKNKREWTAIRVALPTEHPRLPAGERAVGCSPRPGRSRPGRRDRVRSGSGLTRAHPRPAAKG